MPFETHWRPSPDAESLEVHETLPAGFTEGGSVSVFSSSVRLAHNAEGREMYYCHGHGGFVHKSGWIDGAPEENHVDDMRFLSGRRGTTYNCRKCGSELGFVGMIS